MSGSLTALVNGPAPARAGGRTLNANVPAVIEVGVNGGERRPPLFPPDKERAIPDARLHPLTASSEVRAGMRADSPVSRRRAMSNLNRVNLVRLAAIAAVASPR
jgi:hypothetical protein